MRKEGFEFEADNLDHSTAEREISRYCGLTDIQSSGLPWVLSTDKRFHACFSAENGSAECDIIVYNKSKSEEKHEYLYHVSGIEVTQSRRKR